jgi:tetrahydromethanopterin S-methyltransferase subunit G
MKVKKEPKENVSNKDFEAIMSRLNELENEEGESIERAKEIKVENTVEVKKEDESEDSKVVAPKGVSQEEFENLIKRVDQMIESSDDEEDYEDEDMSEDENALDSDDSLPEVVNEIIKEKQVKLESPSKVPPVKKSGVRFSSELETGPTVTSIEKSLINPKPILRNKDVKTPVDEEAVKKMNEVVPERKILPATDAFKGVFVERNPHTLEPSTSAATEMKKPVSKFKAKRMNL